MNKKLLAGIPLLALLVNPTAWAEDLPQAVNKKQEMVVTANPLASKAGADILKKGGTAADAMVAVQTVLGLVEPQSSGMGGGAFVVYYDAKTGTTTTIDAREKAPATATEDRFVQFTLEGGGGFGSAAQSGLSVGVPGTPRMMEYVQNKFGKLKWKKLFKEAEKLAEKGFLLTERTSSQVTSALNRNESCTERLYLRDPTAFEYFTEYMEKLAKEGADGFYYGEIARNIADAVQGDLNVPGDMTVDDLANYNVVERAPVCIDYRGHNVCGMGPPSSGALAVGQILGILENYDISGMSPLDVETVHLFTQAGRLAFADRGLYVADSDFVDVPVEGMLNKAYLAERDELIGPTDMGTAEPGTPPPGDFASLAADPTAKLTGTSHVSIVDRWGNALSMTTTIEGSFGNDVMVNGFLLNNELTDFSFSPSDENGIAIANRVEANKRPRSSMSPTIVFDADGRVEIVTGSPGGSAIIGYTAQSIVNIIDFGLDPQEAINMPHYQNRNGSTSIEMPIPGITLDYDSAALEAELEARGHNARVTSMTSGLSIIQVLQDKSKKSKKSKKSEKSEKSGKHTGHDHGNKTTLVGGADHRRDGTVSGR
jgi:gamma-glutamyltranspeptidase/glutathione hydrolase